MLYCALGKYILFLDIEAAEYELYSYLRQPHLLTLAKSLSGGQR